MFEHDEDPAGTEVRGQLGDHPSMAQVWDWILNLIDKSLLTEADFVPWTPADVHEIAERHEVDSKTDKELFAIARKRFKFLGGRVFDGWPRAERIR